MPDRLDYDFVVNDRGTSTLAKGAAGLRQLDQAGDKARRGSLQLADAQLKVRSAMLDTTRAEGRVADARKRLADVTVKSTATEEQKRKATLAVQSAEVGHARALLRVQQATEGAARVAREGAAATDDSGRASRRAADASDDSARRHVRAFGVIRAGARGMSVAVGAAFGGIGIAAAAAAGGVLLLVGQAKGWISEARDAEKVGRLTAAAIKSTGGAAHVTAPQIADYAAALSNKIGVDDEAIQSAENLLLTFTKVRNEAGRGNDLFNRASGAILDMTAAMNNGEITEEKMRGTTVLLGKALNDPIRGLSALSRVGVTFDKGQRDQIKTMVEHGNILGAQKIILGELTKEFGGAAAAGADAGKRLSTVWGNFKETLGTALLPAFNDAANWLSARLPAAAETGAAKLKEWGPKAFGWWQQNWPDIGTGMVTIARVGLGLATSLAGVAAAGLYAGSGLLYLAAASVALVNPKLAKELLSQAGGLRDAAGRAIEFGNAIQDKTNPMLDRMQGELQAAKAAADRLKGKDVWFRAPGAVRSAAEINTVQFAAGQLPRSKTVNIDIRSNARSAVTAIRGALNSIQDRTTYHTLVLRTVRAMEDFPSGGYAAGTDSARRGWALVGEGGGPELVHFRGGEQVLTAAQTRRAMSGAGAMPGYAAGTVTDPAARAMTATGMRPAGSGGVPGATLASPGVPGLTDLEEAFYRAMIRSARDGNMEDAIYGALRRLRVNGDALGDLVLGPVVAAVDSGSRR